MSGLPKFARTCRATAVSIGSIVKVAIVAREEISKTAVVSEGLRKLLDSAQGFGNQGSTEGFRRTSSDDLFAVKGGDGNYYAKNGGFITAEYAMDLVRSYAQALDFLDKKDFNTTLYGPQVRMGLHELEEFFRRTFPQMGRLKQLAEEYRSVAAAEEAAAGRGYGSGDSDTTEIEAISQTVQDVRRLMIALPHAVAKEVPSAAAGGPADDADATSTRRGEQAPRLDPRAAWLALQAQAETERVTRTSRIEAAATNARVTEIKNVEKLTESIEQMRERERVALEKIDTTTDRALRVARATDENAGVVVSVIREAKQLVASLREVLGLAKQSTSPTQRMGIQPSTPVPAPQSSGNPTGTLPL